MWSNCSAMLRHRVAPDSDVHGGWAQGADHFVWRWIRLACGCDLAGNQSTSRVPIVAIVPELS
jgi:hypothetical protein